MAIKGYMRDSCDGTGGILPFKYKFEGVIGFIK